MEDEKTVKLLQQLYGLLYDIEIKAKVVYHFLFFAIVLNVFCCIAFVWLYFLR